MKKILSLFLALTVLLSLCSCRVKEGNNEKFETRSRVISSFYFNTHSAIYTYKDKSDENIEKYRSIAEGILKYYHELFDIYYEYSGVNNIKTINKNAGKAPVTVDAELIDFLEYCKELYTVTGGKTNVMLGSVLKIWHDCREEASADFGFLNPDKLPTKAELEGADQHTSIDSLVIDREASTVYISDPEASIDVGAIAKGYTVDIIYERLLAEGADSIVLNIGGNIRTIGLKPDGSEWVTGITNPDRSEGADSLICRISIGSAALVTSGDYERFFYAGDKKYHHIIDPETLMPSAYFTSVSVLTDKSGLADALSTALFCMSYEDGFELVSSIGGVEVIWVDLDYNIKTTSGISIISQNK